MGIDIKIVDEEPFITHTKKGDVDVILVHFLAERVGEIKPGDDIREWQWFEVDKLPDKLAPNILTVLKHFKFL